MPPQRDASAFVSVLPLALPEGDWKRVGLTEVCRGFASFLESRLRLLPGTQAFVQHLIYTPKNETERKGFVMRRAMWSLDEALGLPRPEGVETTHVVQGRLAWTESIDLTLEVIDARAAYMCFQRRIECRPEALMDELPEVLADLARSLAPDAPPESIAAAARRPTDSIHAFRFWLRGLASIAGCQLEVPPYDALATFDLLLEAIRHDEDFIEPCLALDGLARLQLRSRHEVPQSVVAALEVASRRRPDFHGFLATLGHAHAESGNHRAAREALEKHAALTVRLREPQVAEALALLAGLRQAQGDNEGAYQLLKEAAARFPRDTRLLEALGLLHLRNGHFGPAERCWRKVLEFEPRRSASLSHLAALLAKRGDRARARILFERSIDDDATPAAPQWRAAIDHFLEEADEIAADAAATRWAETDPDNWRAWLSAGRMRSRLGQRPAAEHCLGRAEALVGGAEETGEIQRTRFAIRHPAAHATFERAMGRDLSPPSAESGEEEARRADVLREATISALRRLADSHPGESFLWEGLAEKLIQCGRHELAAGAQAQVVALRPASAPAHNAYGFLMARIGRRHEAASAFERAVELDGAATAYRTNLAAARIELGDFDQARVHLHKALDSDPRDGAAAALLQELNRREDELADARAAASWTNRLLAGLRSAAAFLLPRRGR